MDLVEKIAEQSDRHPWEVARFKIIMQLFKSHAKVERDSEFIVLDIGCGDTYVAEEFLKVYPNAHYIAVDTAFSTKMIQQYNDHFLKLKVNLSLYQHVEEVNSTKADFVFMFDVIEHIEQETLFLSQLKQGPLLAENAKLFITVPAFNSLFTSHDVYLKHYRRYNKKRLLTSIQNAGFVSISQGFFFFTLLFPRMLQKAMEKFRKVDLDKGIGQWESKGVIDVILVKVLLFDYAVANMLSKIGIRLPGLSNYVVCKKS